MKTLILLLLSTIGYSQIGLDSSGLYRLGKVSEVSNLLNKNNLLKLNTIKPTSVFGFVKKPAIINDSITKPAIINDSIKINKSGIGSTNINVYGGDNVHINLSTGGSIRVNDFIKENEFSESKNRSSKWVDPNRIIALVTLILSTIPIIISSTK